jgi:ParB-like chromosome segregation protein Spo0J
MGGQLIEGEGVGRTNGFKVPPELLTVIGVDTSHCSMEEHPRFDRRALNVHGGLSPDDPEVLSIKEIGVQQDIHVEVENVDGVDRYIVIDGRGRTLRARLANQLLKREGLPPKTVPVKAFRKTEKTEQLGTTLQIVLNEHRWEDTPRNRAEKASYLIATGYSRDVVAKMFRVTSQTIGEWLRFLDLAPEVQGAVENGDLSATAATKLHALPHSEQKTALETISQNGKPTVEKASAVAKGSKRGTGAAASATVAPTKRQLRTAVENGAGVLPADVILTLRVVLGDAPPTDIAGLADLLSPNRSATTR